MSITPVGPHAHLYPRFGITVRQLEEVPDHDDVRSQHLDVDLWCWCPVCGRRVAEIWSYLLKPPLVIYGPFYMGGAWSTAAQKLQPCSHVVSTVVITTHPNDVAETPLTSTPVYATLPMALGDEARPYSRVTFDPAPERDLQVGDTVDTPAGPMTVTRTSPGGWNATAPTVDLDADALALPPDGWPWGDRCHAPFEPSITGRPTLPTACHCGGDPRRPRWPTPRPARPNPSAYSDGGGGRGRQCALCGSSVTHYGWEKRRLRRGSWRRRWVHIDCPD